MSPPPPPGARDTKSRISCTAPSNPCQALLGGSIPGRDSQALLGGGSIPGRVWVREGSSQTGHGTGLRIGLGPGEVEEGGDKEKWGTVERWVAS